MVFGKQEFVLLLLFLNKCLGKTDLFCGGSIADKSKDCGAGQKCEFTRANVGEVWPNEGNCAEGTEVSCADNKLTCQADPGVVDSGNPTNSKEPPKGPANCISSEPAASGDNDKFCSGKSVGAKCPPGTDAGCLFVRGVTSESWPEFGVCSAAKDPACTANFLECYVPATGVFNTDSKKLKNAPTGPAKCGTCKKPEPPASEDNDKFCSGKSVGAKCPAGTDAGCLFVRGETSESWPEFGVCSAAKDPVCTANLLECFVPATGVFNKDSTKAKEAPTGPAKCGTCKKPEPPASEDNDKFCSGKSVGAKCPAGTDAGCLFVRGATSESWPEFGACSAAKDPACKTNFLECFVPATG